LRRVTVRLRQQLRLRKLSFAELGALSRQHWPTIAILPIRAITTVMSHCDP
jgi:hypothetical protein